MDQCLFVTDHIKGKIGVCMKISLFDVIKLCSEEATSIYRCNILLCQKAVLVSVKYIFSKNYST